MAEAFSVARILQAAARLHGRIVTTAIASSPKIDAVAGCHVIFKLEALQHSGAFKFRGALNKLLTLDAATRQRGVVAFSTGNHGHAVSAAAAMLECPAVVVIPRTAPAVKVENCRWWGAEVVLYDPTSEDREAISRRLAAERGLTLVPPFDDDDVIAGQGTAGLELAAQCQQAGTRLDALVVPCSGGGLAAGTLLALKSIVPALACHIVEPAGLEKMAPSLVDGVPRRRPAGPSTILDGISGPIAGTRTLTILRRLNVQAASVSDDEVRAAMALVFQHLKVVLEPAGAAPLAAILRNPARFRGQNVAVMASGGNVDPRVFAEAIAFD